MRRFASYISDGRTVGYKLRSFLLEMDRCIKITALAQYLRLTMLDYDQKLFYIYIYIYSILEV